MHRMLERVQDWLLQKGINGEIRKSGLAEASLQLPWGEISYLCSGNPGAASTEAILMLHGAAADKTSWVRFCRHMKTGLPLLIPDLPGHGKSTSDSSLSYGIDAQVQRLVEMLDALRIKRVHVIANSMGGAIALRLAARQPELVSSLVLIGIVGVQAKESWLQERIRETGQNPMIEIRTTKDYVQMTRIGMSKPPYMPGFVLSSLARNYISRLAINEKILNDIAPDLDQSDSLPDISCPALIVWGREDRVSHVSNAELLRQRLHSGRVEILEGVGHVPMVEVPALVAKSCLDFFSSQTPGTTH